MNSLLRGAFTRPRQPAAFRRTSGYTPSTGIIGVILQHRRFYAPPGSVKGRAITLDEGESHHLSRVLRMNEGDRVFVFDGVGKEYECRVSRIARGSAELEIIKDAVSMAESPLSLTLAQAMAKTDKFDFIVQKATELGVHGIIPLVTDHADVKLDDTRAGERRERWRRISLESLKQCGRSTLVEITLPARIDSLLELKPIGSGRLFIAFTESGGAPLVEATGGTMRASAITLMVGPEGGWSEREIELMTRHNVIRATLGPRVLRTETAAVAAVTLLQHLHGDLSVPRR